LICNSGELLGEAAAVHAARVADAQARRSAAEALLTYGDGRLAPHKWIRTSAGIMKLDAAGHDQDHTAVGPQPLWWDIAGASVEWELSDATAGCLPQLAGLPDHPATAAYFRAAYTAFRAGIADLCLGSCAPDAASKRQFAAALGFYRARLERELNRLDGLMPAQRMTRI
jgi:hypothetical protein